MLWLGQTEKCDICKGDLHPYQDKHWYVDGKTIYGPWCWVRRLGVETAAGGLGLGKGQKYSADTNEKIEG